MPKIMQLRQTGPLYLKLDIKFFFGQYHCKAKGHNISEHTDIQPWGHKLWAGNFWSWMMHFHCCQKTLFTISGHKTILYHESSKQPWKTTYTIGGLGSRRFSWPWFWGVMKFKSWGQNFYKAVGLKLGWILGQAPDQVTAFRIIVASSLVFDGNLKI